MSKVFAKFTICPYCEQRYNNYIIVKRDGEVEIIKCLSCGKDFKLTTETIDIYVTEKIK